LNEVAFAACAVTAAAMVQGLSGFGFGMMAMGLLPLVFPVTEAVPVVALLGVLVSGTVLVAHRRSVRLGTVLPLVAGSLLGVPLGVWFLTGADPGVLRTTLGLVLVVFSLHGLLGRVPATPPETGGAARWHGALGAAAGVVGGALGGAFNVGGPPLIVYVTWRRMEPAVMKATLQCCFVLASCVQLAMFVRAGIVTHETVVTAAAGVPAIGAGLFLGLLASRRISRTAFRRVVLVLLLGLGAWFLVKGAA